MFRLPPLTTFVRALLYVLGASFVLTALAENFADVPVVPLFALNTRDISIATLWQMFTNVVVQSPREGGAVFSLLLNLLFIWLILPPFEDRYGRTRVVQLALFTTLCSSVLALLAGHLFPAYAAWLSGPGPITLGAISAYAVLLPPHAEVSFFGVLPMQSKHLLWLVVGISVLGFLSTRVATSLASDLGAIGGGIAFVKWWMHRPPRRGTFQRKPSRLRVVGRDDDRPGGGWLN